MTLELICKEIDCERLCRRHHTSCWKCEKLRAGKSPKNRAIYTEDEFITAVKTSLSLAEVMRQLKIVVAGGNYSTVRNNIKRLELDTSHFTGSGWNTGDRFRTVVPARPLEELLVNNSPTPSNQLKNKLLKAKLFERKCYSCNLTEWMKQPIAIELEHINGNKNDNRLENLTILCPNCHALTSTYHGKNIGNYK